MNLLRLSILRLYNFGPIRRDLRERTSSDRSEGQLPSWNIGPRDICVNISRETSSDQVLCPFSPHYFLHVKHHPRIILCVLTDKFRITHRKYFRRFTSKYRRAHEFPKNWFRCTQSAYSASAKSVPPDHTFAWMECLYRVETFSLAVSESGHQGFNFMENLNGIAMIIAMIFVTHSEFQKKD